MRASWHPGIVYGLDWLGVELGSKGDVVTDCPLLVHEILGGARIHQGIGIDGVSWKIYCYGND